MFQRRKVQEAQTGCYYLNLFELYASRGKKKQKYTNAHVW
jgi:hypothetical protein